MEYGVENYFYKSFLDGETVIDQSWLEPIPVVNGQTTGLGEQADVQVEILKSGEEDCGLTGLLMKAGEEIVVEYEKKRTDQRTKV